MKVRKGFVSNSSSSSFVLGIKNEQDLSHDLLMKVFQVPETSPVYGLVSDFAEFIVDSSNIVDIESFLANYGYKSLEEVINDSGYGSSAAQLLQDGWTVYTFEGSNEAYGESGFDMYFYSGGIEIDTPELVLYGLGD